MSDAERKNYDAIKALTGNEVESRLRSYRIGIWSEDKNSGFSGYLIAEALGEFVGRLWKNIDATGPFAKPFLASAINSTKSGNVQAVINETWSPPYDYVVSIGSDLPNGTKTGLKIGGSGWKAFVGQKSFIDDDRNPVGPMLVAAIASTEIFKTLFNDCLACKFLPPDFELSAWYGTKDLPPVDLDLHFDDVHFFGIGAVTHGLLWILERWPYKVTGNLHLIDHDSYDISNAQRYVGMCKEDVGFHKSSQTAARLQKRHGGLTVFDYQKNMNDYFSENRSDYRVKIAVAGLDSIEGRRQLGLKLPYRLVNMWTSQEHFGVSRSGFDKNWPCIFCSYPYDKSMLLDEVGIVFQETGLPPSRIRELLDSGAALTQEDAAIIIQRIPQEIQFIVGKPLRTFRGFQCATGKIKTSAATTEVDIPLVFASGFAGLCGFIELSRELWNVNSIPGAWQTSVLAYPTEYSWIQRGKMSDCYLCSDPLVLEIINKKYYDKSTI